MDSSKQWVLPRKVHRYSIFSLAIFPVLWSSLNQYLGQVKMQGMCDTRVGDQQCVAWKWQAARQEFHLRSSKSAGIATVSMQATHNAGSEFMDCALAALVAIVALFESYLKVYFWKTPGGSCTSPAVPTLHVPGEMGSFLPYQPFDSKSLYKLRRPALEIYITSAEDKHSAFRKKL